MIARQSWGNVMLVAAVTTLGKCLAVHFVMLVVEICHVSFNSNRSAKGPKMLKWKDKSQNQNLKKKKKKPDYFDYKEIFIYLSHPLSSFIFNEHHKLMRFNLIFWQHKGVAHCA